jgi:hypothetical protein
MPSGNPVTEKHSLLSKWPVQQVQQLANVLIMFSSVNEQGVDESNHPRGMGPALWS